MPKRFVNALPILIYVFHLFAIVAVLAACTSSVLDVVTPWRLVRTISSAALVEQPALWADGTTALLAWPGEPASVNLVEPTSDAQPHVLTLDTRPRDITLYPAPGGKRQLLWLGDVLPGDTRLMSALLGADRTVEGGPSMVSSQPAVEYSAAIMPTGDLLVFWIATGDRATPLYTQVIDTSGRALPPMQLAASASHPSAVYSPNGTLHIAWLEPGSAQLWTIRYMSFSSGVPLAATGLPAGVIHLSAGEALERFALGLDTANVYCVWSTLSIGNTGEPMGRLSGLTFPIGNPTAAREVSVPGLDSTTSIRWPTVPARQPLQGPLQLGVTVSNWDGHSWRRTPAIMSVTPNGISAAQPVLSPSNEMPLLGPVALSADPGGTLYMAWSVLHDNGTSTIYYAANHP